MSDARPELWVGAECTINRIGDRWRDQSLLTGFRDRINDLDRMAGLGAKRIRLPILWEHVQPDERAEADFAWSDRAMRRARESGMRAIVGLLHHGSGPSCTSLVDSRFPRLFADYARRVAERYPDQDWWTPINEPLTTARFSCLYGVWYPHHQDDRSFVRALLNQVHATVLAMRAIRKINPQAALVQTDDLGHTRCTPDLVDQAAFDNERRWLAFDLLAGKVDRHHLLWEWLRACGADEQELRQLQEAPCPPTLIGINAYVTSERFLDERLDLHPAHLHGGNGRDRYVDIETVRAHGGLIHGFAGRLREAHARYGLPLAITEVHLGCTREEQMRWFHQAWQAAEQTCTEGIAVLGVTAWAAFGTMDWDSLLTREEGHYEPGLWDIRGGVPRMTALGSLVSALAKDERSPHPVLASPGWWQRDLRHVVAAHGEITALPLSGAPVLILGHNAVARAFARLCHMRGLPAERFDSLSHNDVEGLIARVRPWAAIDATPWDEPESEPTRCRARPAPLRWLTVARDATADASLDEHPCHEHLVVRARDLFGPWDNEDFVARGVALLRRGGDWILDHSVVCPTYLPDLVQACLDLLIDGESGVWPMSNGEALIDVDFARRVASILGADPAQVRGRETTRARPAHAVGGWLLPTLADALSRFAHDRRGSGLG